MCTDGCQRSSFFLGFPVAETQIDISEILLKEIIYLQSTALSSLSCVPPEEGSSAEKTSDHYIPPSQVPTPCASLQDNCRITIWDLSVLPLSLQSFLLTGLLEASEFGSLAWLGVCTQDLRCLRSWLNPFNVLHVISPCCWSLGE